MVAKGNMNIICPLAAHSFKIIVNIIVGHTTTDATIGESAVGKGAKRSPGAVGSYSAVCRSKMGWQSTLRRV
jgi:hypothetical protein